MTEAHAAAAAKYDGSDPDLGFTTSTQCPRCRYDLAGLPAAHECPECGLAYDDRVVIPLDRPFQPRTTAHRVGGAASVLFGLYWGAEAVGDFRRQVWIVGAGATVVALFFFWLALRMWRPPRRRSRETRLLAIDDHRVTVWPDRRHVTLVRAKPPELRSDGSIVIRDRSIALRSLVERVSPDEARAVHAEIMRRHARANGSS